MPAPEQAGAFQKALIWPAILDAKGRPVSDANGQPKVSVGERPPTEINVRWDGSRRSVVGPLGQPIAVDATLSHLDRELSIGTAVWQGGLKDLPGTALVPETDLMIVILYNEAPDPKGRFAYREAMLQRFGDALPTNQ